MLVLYHYQFNNEYLNYKQTMFRNCFAKTFENEPNFPLLKQVNNVLLNSTTKTVVTNTS